MSDNVTTSIASVSLHSDVSVLYTLHYKDNSLKGSKINFISKLLVRKHNVKVGSQDRSVLSYKIKKVRHV